MITEWGIPNHRNDMSDPFVEELLSIVCQLQKLGHDNSGILSWLEVLKKYSPHEEP